VVYTGGEPAHPWTVYVADAIHADLEQAVAALLTAPGGEGLRLVPEL
jgi:hypothetical protein